MSRLNEYLETNNNGIAQAADLIQRYCDTLRNNEDLSGEGLSVLAMIEREANHIMEYAAHE